MMTIQYFLQTAKQAFQEVTDNPLLEAEILLAHVLDKPRSYLHAWPEKMLSKDEVKQFADLMQRRVEKEPIAYITGMRSFWSLELLVNRDTLIPRPETELLVETALKLFPETEAMTKVADLGTGSGAIALALAHDRPKWQIYAVDDSEKALQIARKNAQQLGLTQISFCQGNWCTALPCFDFDMIVSNPPYIAETEWDTYVHGLAFEPRHALVSGQDGLFAIREISKMAKAYLKPGGYLMVEHGYSQGEAVEAIFAKDQYTNVYSLRDFSGQKRITLGRLPV